ncbi:MAG: glycosyltransferase family 4 protein [Candidatus Bipolaricaulota bacterium]
MKATVVFAGAHLGYDLTQDPLGGGAHVGLHLVRRWSETRPFELVVLGSGPGEGWDRFPGVEYRELGWQVPGSGNRLTELTVRGYARFSRQFERGVTRELENMASGHGTDGICVLHNDICEAGDFGAIHARGCRQATILHVDVVDYAASVYLRGLVSAGGLARAARAVDRLGGLRLTPDVLRLIFRKQEACARFSDLLVVPSGGMQRVLQDAYPWRTADDVLVIPWGSLPAGQPSADGAEARGRLGLPSDRSVLIALSRISPEKGQDILLRALSLWEKRGGRPLTVVLCGAPAYMHGRRYMRKLQRLAGRLRQTDVRFAGYVAGQDKADLLSAADLYVFPSRHESYGLTLVEAMRHGLPVLTTDHRSAGELVRPEFGRVVRPTPQGVARGLDELLAGGVDITEMGRKARQFAEQRTFPEAADRLAEGVRALM